MFDALYTRNGKLCISGSVVINDGEQASDPIDLEGTTSIAIHIPSGWDDTGDLSVEASSTKDGTYHPIDGVIVTGTEETWQAIDLEPFRYIRFTTASAVTGDQVIEFLAKG